MVGGMDGGMISVMTFILACTQSSKSYIQSCDEELVKDKSISSEQSQFLGDESSRLRGWSSMKGSHISYSDISENKYISDTWENEITMVLKA